MFPIRKEQIESLDAIADDKFVDELAEYLCNRNICVLPRYPEEQRREIVRIMIARSRIWGATWESSISLYADLMQTVAPNFDQFPAIREVLQTGEVTADERILTINNHVQRTIWQEAESARVELYLYTSPELDSAPLSQRTAAALPIVLWDHVSPEQAPEEAIRAISFARELGLVDLEDGPITASVAFALYGGNLTDAKSHPWIADVLDTSPPNVRLEMLRFRIALDFGRRV